MRDRFGATNPRAQQLRFHTQTAGSTLTAQQPDNNIVRVALQALAAVLGGTQSLHCNGKDEALALPTEEAATIALRTQQIILHESGVANTVDPVGGSYAIEEMTDRIEARRPSCSTASTPRRHARGDRVGYIQRRSRSRPTGAAGDRSGDATWSASTGTRTTAVPRTNVFRLDPEIERQQIERVRAVRAGRSEPNGDAALDASSTAAARRRPIWCRRSSPRSKEATLGEIADAMRSVFGEFQDVSPVDRERPRDRDGRAAPRRSASVRRRSARRRPSMT